MHKLLKFLLLTIGAACHAAEGAVSAQPSVTVQDDSGCKAQAGVLLLTVDGTRDLGPIKPMNAVNNGPNFSLDANKRQEQRGGHFVHYRNMRTPMARIHDSRNMASPPGHMGDINAIFPDWSADENDPKNYDFTLTDWQLHAIRLAGTEVMFRLGNSADQGPKQYGSADVPRDFGKWARVAANVIRHYNEGWGWTNKVIPFANQFNVRYWEIWNEADLGCPADYFKNPKPYWKGKPRYWNGSPEQFFDFYATVSKHLKTTFPALKIGGPAGVAAPHWTERFLAHCQTNAVPIDFFSWHTYARTPEECVKKAAYVRRYLDRFGYTKTESVLNEWNWMKGWYGDEFRQAMRLRTSDNNYLMAAFYAAVMSAMQDTSADMLMYYDARINTHYNALFDQWKCLPLKAYYPFYAWAKLSDRGRQVATGFRGERKGTWATAAKGADGSLAVYAARYTLDANATDTVILKLAVKDRRIAKGFCHLVDEFNQYTEVPLAVMADGTAEIDLRPNAFAFVELRPDELLD